MEKKIFTFSIPIVILILSIIIYQSYYNISLSSNNNNNNKPFSDNKQKQLSNQDINDIKQFFHKASENHYQGNIEQAFLYYDKIDKIFLNPSTPRKNEKQKKSLSSLSISRIKYEINMGRGSIKQEQGQFKDAIKYFIIASKHNVKEDLALFSMITHLANKAKQFNLAKTYHKKWIEQDPNNIEAWYFFAVHLEKYYNNKRNNDALEKYLKAIDLLKGKKISKFETIKSLPASSSSSSSSNQFLIWNAVYHSIGRLLRKMKRGNEAEDYYEQGYEYKLWPHPLRRFISNNRRPKYNSLPHIPASNTKFYPKKIVTMLEMNYRKIKEELYQFVASGINENNRNINNSNNNKALLSFKLENEMLHNNGKWNQLRIYENNMYNDDKKHICHIFKTTCSIFDKIIRLNKDKCRRRSGNDDACLDLMIYFSKLSPGTVITPHCGPSFRRLRIHLGISIPEPKKCSINVANRLIYQWKEGEAFVFDDSFEHFVKHDGKKDRIILVVDIVHPNEYLK